MDKATLKVWTNKKGKVVGQVLFEDGKKMGVPPHYLLSESLNNQPCQVDRIDGHIRKIIVEGIELGPKSENQHTNNQSAKKEAYSYHMRRHQGGRASRKRGGRPQGRQNRDSRTKDSRGAAKAPYNFVPINEVVVQAEFQNPEEFPSFVTYSHQTERYTGYIDLTIETLTPLYIWGMINHLGKDNDETREEPAHFFSPGGIIKIPGSSIRGMVRTLGEIVSWSKFQLFEDKQLYYRAVADHSSLRDEYQKTCRIMIGKRKSPDIILMQGIF